MKILKKGLKIFGIFFLVLIAAIIAIPLLFGDQIKEAVKDYVNESVVDPEKAEVYFKDVGIAIFSNFPNITVTLEEFGVAGKGEFEGDTLVDVGQLDVVINLWSVFGDKYEIKKILLDHPDIHAKVTKTGIANWDITLPSTDSVAVVETEVPDSSTAGSIALELSSLRINEGNLVYDDRYGDMYFAIKNLNFSGSGNIQDENYDFATETTADEVTVRMEGSSYLNKAKLDVDATVNIDNANSKYTLKDNSFGLNQLVLGLDGWVQMVGDDINMDLSFDTKQNTFSNILSMVPGIYSPDFGDMKTDGTFTLNGTAKGPYNAKRLPAFNVNMSATNGYFQYPDLPEAVKDINFDLKVNCPDGNIDNLQINFPKFHAALGKTPIDAKLILAGLTSDNLDIDADIKADIDLAEMTTLFPIEGQELKGKFLIDGTAKGKYNYDGHAFPKVDAKMTLENGYYKSADFPSAIENMRLKAIMVNKNGSLEETTLNMENFHAEVDGSPIDATLMASNFADLNFDFAVEGKLDLGKLASIYPMEGTEMGGIIDLALETEGKVSDLEAGNYSKVPTEGGMILSDVTYRDESLPMGMKIKEALFSFSPQKLDIQEFIGSVGRSRLNITGFLDNYLAYFIAGDETLHGVMTLNSVLFDVNEFLVESPDAGATDVPAPAPDGGTPAEAGDMEVFEVPNNIDFTFNCLIKKVLYDKMTLKDLTGKVRMANGEVDLSGISFNTLGGSFVLKGKYNTQDIANPYYDMDMSLTGINIQEAYNTISTVQTFAPIAKNINGRFNSSLNLKGKMLSDMSPDLSSLTSVGSVSILEGALSNSKVMDMIASKTKLNNLKDLAVDKVKALYEIHDGRIWVEPFDVAVGKTLLNVEGSNGIDQTIDYDIDIDAPAGKLGSEAVNALSGITGKTMGANESFKINVGLGGTNDKPKITRIGTSKGEGVAGVAGDKIDDLKNQGKEKVDDLKNQGKEKIDDAKAQLAAEKAELERKAREKADSLRNAMELEAQKAREEAERKAKEAADKAKAEADKAKKEMEEKIQAEKDKLKDKFKWPK